MTETLKVYLYDDNLKSRAEKLAESLDLPLIASHPTEKESFKICFGDSMVYLQGDGMDLIPDFMDLKERVKPGRLNTEVLVKACRVKCENQITVFDATAGLGEDSFILAAAGFNVILYEKDPVIYELLLNAWERGRENPEIGAILSRMHIYSGDSTVYLKSLNNKPQVVLLDPMFPERKKSGLIKKKFQLLQKLESPCDNEDSLMEAALIGAGKRIVIKRPVKGPNLAGRKPDFSYPGKAVRYDCILINS
ncbi:MAG: class I SAM-dependent methyltransferase [Lachnospiraceae bacterium]|nr:class I SAM-dependent methyltransferase [Lachnospiraceae bacterium]